MGKIHLRAAAGFLITISLNANLAFSASSAQLKCPATLTLKQLKDLKAKKPLHIYSSQLARNITFYYHPSLNAVPITRPLASRKLLSTMKLTKSTIDLASPQIKCTYMYERLINNEGNSFTITGRISD